MLKSWEHLARDYEIAAQVLEFRMLTKLNGTYVEGMLPLIDSDSRIHAHFQQTVTTTGRLSCTNRIFRRFRGARSLEGF